MTTRLLFVQGGGQDVHDGWDRKLVDSLQKALGPGHGIRYPRMPDEAEPRLARWSAALRKEIDALDDGATLVGHSIGAALLVHTLARHPPARPPAGIFLVSMPFIGPGGWQSDEIAPDPHLGAKLPPRSPVHLYHGGADETVPAAHAELNAAAIPQAVVRLLPGRDHQLNDDMREVAADIRELNRRTLR